MKRTNSIARRLLMIACMLGAFLVMASVFTPQDSRAVDGIRPEWVIQPEVEPPSSTDPHDGLRSLGVLDGVKHTIQIYATDGGPRYTISETATGRELGSLLTAEQMQYAWPEVQLPAVDFSAPDVAPPLMLGEPICEGWWP